MNTKKTLVIFYPGCADYEIMTATELLNERFPIEVVTPDGSDHKGSTGFVFRSNKSFEEIEIDNYACVLIPGGSPESIMKNKTIDEILHDFMERKTVIGAICSAPIILAKSGLLKGRSYTHAAIYPKEMSSLWEGGTFLQKLFVVDDNLVTAQPHGHIEFAIELCKKFDYFPSESDACAVSDYFKGKCKIDWSRIGPIMNK
ncbi:DJ-1/PfpI family protein [bacterium]|nr:DJ-1/PfpI family protein [bacterium]